MGTAALPLALLAQDNANVETFPSPLVSLLGPTQVSAPGDEQGGFFPLWLQRWAYGARGGAGGAAVDRCATAAFSK